MSELSVTLSKLEKYCKANGGYDLEISDNKIALSFSPAFPEAQEKADRDHPIPHVLMIGKISGTKAIFERVEIEDSFGTREKNLEEARLTYEGWINYIEENY